MAVDHLIDRLVADATPVRRLWSPLRRTAAWVGIAMAIWGAVAVLHGTRHDLSERLRDGWFLVGTAAAICTGASAAYAALIASLPDRSRWWLLLPLPAASVWIGGITGGCLLRWTSMRPEGVHLADVLSCLGVLTVVSLPLSALLFLLLRPLLRIAPAGAVMTAGLATAALAAAMLNIVHAFDASVLILIWNFGAALLVLTVDLLAVRALRPSATAR
jgi:hypothetical protein